MQVSVDSTGVIPDDRAYRDVCELCGVNQEMRMHHLRSSDLSAGHANPQSHHPEREFHQGEHLVLLSPRGCFNDPAAHLLQTILL